MYLVGVFVQSGWAVSVISRASPELEADPIKFRTVKLRKDLPSCCAVREPTGRESWAWPRGATFLELGIHWLQAGGLRLRLGSAARLCSIILMSFGEEIGPLPQIVLQSQWAM